MTSENHVDVAFTPGQAARTCADLCKLIEPRRPGFFSHIEPAEIRGGAALN